MNNKLFFNRRRTKSDRRNGTDPRQNPRLDLSHRRRRKSDDRRSINRDIREDFYASPSLFSKEKRAGSQKDIH